MQSFHSYKQTMEVKRNSSPYSSASSYEETDSISSNFNHSVFNSFQCTTTTLECNSIRPKRSTIRHNFKSIEELLSPVPISMQKNDDTKFKSCRMKKTKSLRTIFTDEQKQRLEDFYSINRYPDPSQIGTLSYLLSVGEKVIRIWFQNKRSRKQKF